MGCMNHWTVPMTAVGVVALQGVRFLTGLPPEKAAEICRRWLGPAIGLCSIAILAFLAAGPGGWSLAVCWTLAWPALGDPCGQCRFGNTGQHILHQLLFL